MFPAEIKLTRRLHYQCHQWKLLNTTFQLPHVCCELIIIYCQKLTRSKLLLLLSHHPHFINGYGHHPCPHFITEYGHYPTPHFIMGYGRRPTPILLRDMAITPILLLDMADAAHFFLLPPSPHSHSYDLPGKVMCLRKKSRPIVCLYCLPKCS